MRRRTAATRLALALLAATLDAACGARSAVRGDEDAGADVPPTPTSPYGLALRVTRLAQDCMPVLRGDTVGFAGSVHADVPPAGGALTPAGAEILADDGSVLARFDVMPFELSGTHADADVVKVAGSLSPQNVCLLCDRVAHRVRLSLRGSLGTVTVTSEPAAPICLE